MRQYHNLLKYILENGVDKEDRTGIGTKSVFGYQMRFDLQKGFPLVTTKKVHLKGIIHEILWFLSGSTNVKYLQDHNIKIWDAWSTKEKCAVFQRETGDLGPIYGHQWTNFGGKEIVISCNMCKGKKIIEHIGSNSLYVMPSDYERISYKDCDLCDADYDYISHKCINCDGLGIKRRFYKPDGVNQIKRAIDLIKNNPDSRRIIVSGWNPQECDLVTLPPCHTLFQFNVANNKLSCQLYQRSGDSLLGVPYNIASYSLLTMMIAQVCDLELGEFIHTFGDVHLYNNHIEQAKLQLTRKPRELPKMILNPEVKDIFEFKYKDFKLEGYKPHPKIKAEVAV